MDLRSRIQAKKLQDRQAISSNFVNTEGTQQTTVELEKAKKAAIGEIRIHGGKKVKKIAEGKWVEVSEHGMTRSEHEDKAAKAAEKSQSKAYDKHDTARRHLSDKEYSDEEVEGDKKSLGVSDRRSPETIKKEYSDLKRMSITDLRNKWSISNKIGNPKELDKEGLISDILRSKHGGKYVDAAFNSGKKIAEGKGVDSKYKPHEIGEDENDDRFKDSPLSEVQTASITQVGTPNQRVAEQEMLRRAFKKLGRPATSLSEAIDVLEEKK